MANIKISKKTLSNVNGTHDINFWATGTIDPWLAFRPDYQNAVHETVQKYKARFKEAWEELSNR
jgi:hypothetical protein